MCRPRRPGTTTPRRAKCCSAQRSTRNTREDRRVGGKLLDRPLHAAAALLLVVALVEIVRLHALERIEGAVSDAFVRIHARGLEPDPDIVIVDIDEPSLARMEKDAGKFPWPRKIYGQLVRGL